MNNFKNTILLPTLELIRNDQKIKKFYFYPGLFSVTFLSVILTYQGIYTYVEIFWKQEEAFKIILDFFQSRYIIEALISLGVIFILYIVVIPIFEWALIRYISVKNNSNTVSCSESLWVGFFRFYSLFEFGSIFNMFKFISLLNAYLFSLRFLGLEYIKILNIFFIVAFLFSLIINILLAYTRFEIVLEKKSTYEAIGVSTQIALLTLKTTLYLYFLMFLMNFRVLFNFLIFLWFPLLALSLTSIFTSYIFTTVVLGVLGIIFLVFLIALWYMAWVLEIFTKKMWYQAYIQGKWKLENS